MTLLQAVYKVKSSKRRMYFLWKHKLRNNKFDYSNLTKEEFIKKFCHGSMETFERLEMWERSEEYARLILLLIKEQTHNDFFDVYNVVAEKARQGDEKNIKMLLLLQKEVKSKLRAKEEALEDDELLLS